MKCAKCGGQKQRGVCLICPMLEAQSPPGAPLPAGWPLYSRTLAVHPDEIPAAMAIDQAAGVRTEYDASGRPKLESPGHRAKYVKVHSKAMGRTINDYDSGYGHS